MTASARHALTLAAALTAASPVSAADGAPNPGDLVDLPRNDTLVLEGTKPAVSGNRIAFMVHAGIADGPAFLSDDTAYIALVPKGANSDARRSCPFMSLTGRDHTIEIKSCGLFGITAAVNAAATPSEIASVENAKCVVTEKPALDFSQC